MAGSERDSGRAADDAELLLSLLRERGLSVATAESLTGGLVAASITAVPGASESFRGGLVAYATSAKTEVLGVPEDLLRRHGPVADQTAVAMALAAADRFGTDLGVATTGAAGPGPAGEVPPGVVYVAAALGRHSPLVQRLSLSGDRRQVRRAAVSAALRLAVVSVESQVRE